MRTQYCIQSRLGPRVQFFFLFGSWILVLGISAHAANWPSWRGPDGTGDSSEFDFPIKWNNTEGVKWKVEMPGPGNSTPIVWGEKVIVSCATEKGAKRGLLCFNRADGKLLWKQEIEFKG